MKQPFRVAVVGRANAAIASLLAGLSPAILPRLFAGWAMLEPSFLAELVVVLPGEESIPPLFLTIPVLALGLDDLKERPSAFEARLLEARDPTPTPLSRLLGPSLAMARVRGVLAATAKSPLPLLLTGENGTGKDLAATVAHELSPGAGQTFVPVNCGAIPAGLAETEFFGCVRGAFTGAENRMGFCHQAHGGTLFLDEVAEMPSEIQAKLLRVLENHEIRKVGSSRVETADFRLICATNRDLAAEVKAGRFREDLYYRINVLSLKMPPLRERKDDLPLLADHFLGMDAGLVRPVRLTPRALAKMTDYHWPGNLRQLRNVIQRAAVFHAGEALEPEHLEWEP